jgi:glycosyltransferase involved in cell wall biosynthesis
MSHAGVTAVIPCFNGSAYLADAIESAVSQTVPVDVIVINDGSTDDFRRAVRPYEGRIRMIEHDRNRGVASARNNGIEAAETEWIAFLDADDRWHRTKTERQLNFVRDNPGVELVSCDRSWIDAAGSARPAPPYRRPSGTPTVATLLRCIVMQPSTVMVRRTALGTDRFEPSLRSSEDWDLWLQLAQRGVSMRVLQEPLVEYRVHATNKSRHRETMARCGSAVLTRALERGLPRDLAVIAKTMRRRYIEALGHVAYERHDWAQARRHFQASGIRHISMAGRRRWLLASMPGPLREVIRRRAADISV